LVHHQLKVSISDWLTILGKLTGKIRAGERQVLAESSAPGTDGIVGLRTRVRLGDSRPWANPLGGAAGAIELSSRFNLSPPPQLLCVAVKRLPAALTNTEADIVENDLQTLLRLTRGSINRNAVQLVCLTATQSSLAYPANTKIHALPQTAPPSQGSANPLA
jgi:hypothetical protein